LVTTAAGLRKDRGDLVKIAVVDFAADSGRDLAPVEPPSLLETLARQAGSFVSSGAIVLVALLLLWFGLRPATRMLLAPPAESASAFAGGLSELPPPMSALESLGPGGPAMALGNLGGSDQNFLIDANERARRLPQGTRGAQGQESATPSAEAGRFRRRGRGGDSQAMDP